MRSSRAVGGTRRWLNETRLRLAVVPLLLRTISALLPACADASRAARRARLPAEFFAGPARAPWKSRTHARQLVRCQLPPGAGAAVQPQSLLSACIPQMHGETRCPGEQPEHDEGGDDGIPLNAACSCSVAACVVELPKLQKRAGGTCHAYSAATAITHDDVRLHCTACLPVALPLPSLPFPMWWPNTHPTQTRTQRDASRKIDRSPDRPMQRDATRASPAPAGTSCSPALILLTSFAVTVSY